MNNMNENKKEIVAKTIWSATNLLRGTHSMSHNIECILEMLFWRYISNKNNREELGFESIPEGCDFNDLYNYIGKLSYPEYCDRKYSELLNSIHHHCDIRPLCSFSEGQKLHQDDTSLRELIKMLHNIPDDVDFIRNMFDATLQFTGVYLGREAGEWCSPSSINTLVSSLLGIREDNRPDLSIYDPTCGSASLLIECGKAKECHYYGQDINERQTDIAKMNLIIHGQLGQIACGDTLRSPALVEGDELRTFDYVVSNPPFGMRSDDLAHNPDIFRRWGEGTNAGPLSKNNSDYAFLLHLVHSMKADTGRGIGIFMPGILFRSSERHFREYLIEDKKCIEGIISLPSNLLFGTGIPLCLIIFNNVGAKHRNNIFVIDAKDEFVKSGAKNELSPENINKIVTTWNGKQEVPGFSRKVPIEEIRRNDYNLNVPHYLETPLEQPLSEGEVIYSLSDIIETVKFTPATEIKSQLPLIGMSELSSNYLNCDIAIDNLPLKPRNVGRVLTVDALLVGYMGNKFKVGRITGVSPDKPVLLRHEVFAFQLKSDIQHQFSEEFILRSFFSDYVLSQARNLSYGVVIQRISEVIFWSLKVIAPSYEEQLRICKEDTRASLTESDRKLLESFDEFRRDMHVKKHAIGQTLFNLNNWWSVLERARREGHGIVDDNAVIGNTRKIKITDIYDNLKTTIKKLETQLNKLDTGYGMKVEQINLPNFVEKYIAEHRSPVFRFYFQSDDVNVLKEDRISDDDFHEEVKPIIVEFAPEALTDILNNIVSNACNYGFANKVEYKNMIQLNITQSGTDYIVEISNNGAPLASGVTSDDVFTYGRTTGDTRNHFGIGGYEIKKLMREFNGDAELSTNPDNDYHVTYKLIFHNTNLTN